MSFSEKLKKITFQSKIEEILGSEILPIELKFHLYHTLGTFSLFAKALFAYGPKISGLQRKI